LLRFLLALPPPTPFYTLSLHDALPIFAAAVLGRSVAGWLGLGQRTIIEPLTAGMSGPRANAIHTAADLGAKDDPAGLPAVFQSEQGYRWGNGMALRWHLNAHGQLAQMRWEQPGQSGAALGAWLTAWMPAAWASEQA